MVKGGYYATKAAADLVSAQAAASTSLAQVLSPALKEDDAAQNRVGMDGLEGREARLKKHLKTLDDMTVAMMRGTSEEEKKAAARAEVDEYLATYTYSPDVTRADKLAALAKARAEPGVGARRRRKSKTRARKSRKTRTTRRR
jgi:hypothetical protein